MQRGVVNLTPTQAQLALFSLKQAEVEDPTILSRLQAAINSSESVEKVQLSQEEAELILDLLPSPTTFESVDLRQLRSSLQQFLISLH